MNTPSTKNISGIFTAIREFSFETPDAGNTAVIIIAGHGLFRYSDIIDTFLNNTIFIVVPNQHVTLINESNLPMTLMVFHFPPALLLINRFNFHAYELLEKHFSENGPCLKFKITEKDRLHFSLYEPLLNYTPDLTTSGTSMAFAHLYTSMFIFLTDAWLSHYTHALPEKSGSSKTQQTIYKIKQYIHENYNQPLSLEQLSKYTQLNPAYLSRLFKQQTKMTIITYINQTRIEHAKILLTNSDDLIIDIAYACGFPNICNFNLTFKKLTGYTPGEYRKASRSTYYG